MVSRGGVVHGSNSIVEGRGVAYGFMLRPSGINVCSMLIQWLSFRRLKLTSFLWIFSTAMMVKSWMEWSDWQKCLATGLSVRRWCMSDLWPVNRTRSAFSVSPTYWAAAKCAAQYVGETENALRVRLTGHRSDIHHRRTDRPVARHFCQSDHSIHDLTIMAVEKIHRNDVNFRRRKESHWISILHTLIPDGLNINP